MATEIEGFGIRALLFDDGSGIVSGSNSPEVDYPDVPVGYMYIKTNGQIFRKLTDTGVGQAADWEEGAGGTSTVAQALPFFKADGSTSNIPLSLGGLPFFKANLIQSNIPIV